MRRKKQEEKKYSGVLCFRLKARDYAKVEAFAERHDLTLSEAVRELVVRAVHDETIAS